ncbi:hypothetical protein SLA2020_218200 [Shorea laevis]
MAEFRPISCCNLLYKCITKIIANRLKKCLPLFISNNQCAFVEGRLMVENILLAQELVKDYHKTDMQPRCTLKIDLMKAFDSVSWKFILAALEALSFPPVFVNWIKVCITSPIFSIAINGALEGYFPGKKGVRQGDPLSPYLFVICMEVLSRLLNKAAQEGRLPFHPKCSKVGLTHLCFADDLLIFTDGSPKAISVVDSILKEFYSITGLKVNYQKSEIYYCGVQDSIIKNLAATYGFKLGTLPIRYLGVPLITGRLTDAALKPLILKITDRINSWTSRHLSFAGRLQLITSVFQGITNFWCSVFILPKKVIKSVEAICSAFLWKGRATDARGAKVSWEIVCKPKVEGGLGIKPLQAWNKACILRFIWLLFSKAGSIWVAWVQAYLIKGKSFWSLKIPGDTSWFWRKILSLRPTTRYLIKHMIGNGENTFLWFDFWHPTGPLLEVYGQKIVQDTAIPLQAKLSQVVQGNFWKWPPARSPELLQIQIALCGNLYPNEAVEDSVIWLASPSGSFKTGYTWNHLREKQAKVPWFRLVWFANSIPKHSFMSWLAILDRLSTKARQKSWSPHIDATCVLCGAENETRDHLFFSCAYSRTVWDVISSMLEIPSTFSWQFALSWLCHKAKRKSLCSSLIRLAWCAAIYHIWIERNTRIHKRTFKSEFAIVSKIQIDVRDKVLSFARAKSSLLPKSIASKWGLEVLCRD